MKLAIREGKKETEAREAKRSGKKEPHSRGIASLGRDAPLSQRLFFLEDALKPCPGGARRRRVIRKTDSHKLSTQRDYVPSLYPPSIGEQGIARAKTTIEIRLEDPRLRGELTDRFPEEDSMQLNSRGSFWELGVCMKRGKGPAANRAKRKGKART